MSSKQNIDSSSLNKASNVVQNTIMITNNIWSIQCLCLVHHVTFQKKTDAFKILITYLIHVEDHWHLFGHAGEVWSYLNLLDFQRCLHYLYCCCWGYTVVVNVVVVAAAVVVVAVVDGLIHSKSGYPVIVQYVS